MYSIRTQTLILLLSFDERTQYMPVLGLTIGYDVVNDNYYFLFMFYRSVDEHVTTIVYRLILFLFNFFFRFNTTEQHNTNQSFCIQQ